MWWLLACAEPISGVILQPTGEALAGAQVQAPGCSAVSGADGRFSVYCEGQPEFIVSHPAYLSGGGRWTEAGFVANLTPIPQAPGVHLKYGGGFLVPAPLQLERRGDDTLGYAFCAPASDWPRVPSGQLELLDNHAFDWRLFALDTEGCAYRLEHANGAWWTSPSKAISVTRGQPLAPGREQLSVTLQPGRYVMIAWYGGGPVPAEGGYQAAGFEVQHAG